MSPIKNLSAREKEVIQLLLQGKSNKLIARALGISEHTVEFHLKNTYAKFEVNSRLELVLKLRNPSGSLDIEKLGISAVDNSRRKIDNRNMQEILADWISVTRLTISKINQELEMKFLLKINTLLMLLASLLLLFVNWLAFHDIRETHTVRDWLMLTASVLVLLKFAAEFWNRYFRRT